MNLLGWTRPDRLIGMTLPMVLWALHFVAVYSLAGIGCEQDWYRQRLAGTNVLSLVLIVTTLAALVPIALLGWRALHWQRQRPPSTSHDQPGPRLLIWLTGVLAIVATVAVLFTATPIVLLPPCAT